MKIKFVLNGEGGELANKTVEVHDDYEIIQSEAINIALINWLDDDETHLRPGDSIVITEETSP